MASLSLYYKSFYKIQFQIKNDIRKIQKDFLWGSGFVGSKIVVIKWDNICKPKKEGGLGVKDIKLCKIALLVK